MHYDNELFVRHLSGMARFPTVSKVDSADMDMDAYSGMHQYIERTFPLLHKAFKKEIIGRAGLLYTMKTGKKGGRAPLVLMAHQDVVPEGDHAKWKYPPFGGVAAEGCLWGRGVIDSKCNMCAYMDALELLLADGFDPDCDIYLAFGYNEEVSNCAEPAAGLIADELARRGVAPGMVIDECSGVALQNGRWTASVLYCEKGYADFEIYIDDVGGHSCQPPTHSALGLLGLSAWILWKNPIPQRLTEPAAVQMRAMAEVTDGELGELFRDPAANWERLKPLCAADKLLNGLTRTTMALTMAQGSGQANILPEHASFVVNCRLLPGDTIDETRQYIERLLPDGVQIRFLKGNNPPPVSAIDTDGYKVIESVLNDKYPDIKMIPTMLLGGTDSRYFCGICPSGSVYRFTGIDQSKRWATHQVNEHLDCSMLTDNIDFYVRLLRRYGNAE